MFATLLQSSYFALFLIVALGFILGRIQIKGLSLDVSAVIFIALLFGHFGVIIPKELGNFGLVLFIFTIGIQAGPGFFDSFRSKGKTLIILTLLIVGSASLTGLICFRNRYTKHSRTDSRGTDQYTGFGGCNRHDPVFLRFHRLWYCLSVRCDRCDPVCQVVTQNTSYRPECRSTGPGSKKKR